MQVEGLSGKRITKSFKTITQENQCLAGMQEESILQTCKILDMVYFWDAEDKVCLFLTGNSILINIFDAILKPVMPILKK